MDNKTEMKSISPLVRKQIIRAQRNEVTEYHIYNKLAQKISTQKNQKLLERIAGDELRHYETWKKYSGRDVAPNRRHITKYYWIARIFGLTFGLKLMERNEERAQINYREIGKDIPEAIKISNEENEHEQKLLSLIEEDKLKYIGSIVLGLNDALVEILGTLAGLTFALQNNRLVAMAGIIAGIAGALSMSSSEYLSNKSEGKSDRAIKSAVFTGVAYIFAVFFLVTPYLLLNSPWMSLAWAVFNSIFIVFLFSYYISVANNQPFKKRFGEMVMLSTVVGLISFGLGYVARVIFEIEI